MQPVRLHLFSYMLNRRYSLWAEPVEEAVVAEVAEEALEAAEAEALAADDQVRVLVEAEAVPALVVQVQALAVLHQTVHILHQADQGILQADTVVDFGVYQELPVQLL